MSDIERLKARISVDANSGCWIWDRPDNKQGYGRFSFGGRRYLAHRAAFILLRGGIAPGMVLDHTCRNPICVNPAHLEAVSQVVNVRRGFGPIVAKRSNIGKIGAEFNLAKTHCPAGHPYEGENLSVRRDGRRECRICMRARGRASYALLKAKGKVL
jgi:hypothetical protein